MANSKLIQNHSHT